MGGRLTSLSPFSSLDGYSKHIMEPLKYSQSSGKEVSRVIRNISQVLDAEDEDTIVKACLAIAVRLLNPGLPFSRVAEGVTGASEWIYLYGSDPKGVAN